MNQQPPAFFDTPTPVVVTTRHRGVFFGCYSGDVTAKTVTLLEARNCVQWRGLRGFIDLAVSGPGPECRIGKGAPSITLQDVTSIIPCTAQAAENWRREPWRP